MKLALSALLAGLVSSSQVFAWNLGGSGSRLQVVLGSGFSAPASYDAGLFTPVEDLSALSETHFTTLSHPAFPKHSVRIKQSNFCDETVKSYTGYIDIEARHLFFYFFESRTNPDKDDVILWTNGGPGCSSSLGLFMELGPCRIDTNGTKFHLQSWNDRANIFFIDQPVGVGFSYAEHGESVSTTEEAAQDIASFAYLFFEHFTKFKGRKFHLAGESYAGRYLPVFAAYIYDQNERLKEQGLTPVNLASVMIGNGYTHFPTMVESYYDMVCTATSVFPRVGVNACVRMKQVQIRCRQWLQKSCIDVFDQFGCQAAEQYCVSELSSPLMQGGWNPYDISQQCEGSIDDTLCYPITKNISSYLDRPDVRRQIGVDPSLDSREFSSCSNDVSQAFGLAMDEFHPTHQYVGALLEHGVKVLIYVGKNDWICNHVGNERWVRELDWSGKEGYASAEVREWSLHGVGKDKRHGHKKAGDVRSFGGLTFLTIEGAGHMVPYDKPDESLWMTNAWLAGDL